MKIKNINNINFKKLNKTVIYALTLSLNLTGCSIKKETSEYPIIVSPEPIKTEKLITELEIATPAPTIEPIVDDPQIEKKIVAITFDDGPGKYTVDLINILEENNAKATFFVLGSCVEKYPETVIYAYEKGNEIAIHGYSHIAFTKMDIAEVQQEISLTKELIESYGIESSNLVRPPYGSINEDIMEKVNSTFILWNVDTRDWESRNVDKIKEEVIGKIEDGDIILFHDIHKTTVEAIKQILPELTSEYEFVTVSELFNIKEIEYEENKKYYKVKK